MSAVVVESLRSLAAWLDPRREEPANDDREAVRARWGHLEQVATMLGQVARWDVEILRLAAGEPVDDDEDELPGRCALSVAAIRARHQQEPVEVSARRLAHAALLGAQVAGVAGEGDCSSWVTTLAEHESPNRRAALTMARESVGFAAGPMSPVAQRAQRMLAEADEAPRQTLPSRGHQAAGVSLRGLRSALRERACVTHPGTVVDSTHPDA